MVSQPFDATMPFRVVSQPAYGLAHVNGDQGQAELRTLIYSILAGLKPREREVIELSFRHDLYDNDLAIALGVSWSRAHALASRARGRLEKALDALHIALTRREACPVLGELLADWDGQLTERDAQPGQLAHRGVPDLRSSRAGARCARRRFPACCRWPRSLRNCGSRS